MICLYCRAFAFSTFITFTLQIWAPFNNSEKKVIPTNIFFKNPQRVEIPTRLKELSKRIWMWPTFPSFTYQLFFSLNQIQLSSRPGSPLSCSKGKVRVTIIKYSGVSMILKVFLLIGTVLVKGSKNPLKAKTKENEYMQKWGAEVIDWID